MTKKIIMLVLLMAVLFHIAWYAVSRSVQHEKIPDDATAQAAFDKLLKDEEISIDRHAFTEMSIEANGIRIHLDVFFERQQRADDCFYSRHVRVLQILY